MNDSSTTLEAALHAASDEDLACRIQDGCTDSFTELVERLQPRLLYALHRRLQNHADAEDIAQKTLLRVHEKIDLYDPTQKFSPWLFTIAFRLATDYQRTRKLTTTSLNKTSTDLTDSLPTAEQQAIDSELSDDIWTLAEQILKPDQWTALWLLYGEGQNVKEIAQTLNRTSVSVRVLLFRARKTLAPHLSKYTNFVDDTATDLAPSTTSQIARAQS